LVHTTLEKCQPIADILCCRPPRAAFEVLVVVFVFIVCVQYQMFVDLTLGLPSKDIDQ